MRGRVLLAVIYATICASAVQAVDLDQGENFTEARPVVVRVTQRGGLAFPGGEIDFSASRPGWDPYPLKADWDPSSTDGSRRFDIRDDRGETLFQGRSVWSQRNDGAVVGRVVIECVSAVEMQCLAVHASVPVKPPFGLGDGSAAEFDLPISDGRTVRLCFPEPVPYHSQDSRPWFGQWSVRLGGHLGHDGTRRFSPGERLVWDMVISAPDGLALDLARPLDIIEGKDWVRLEYFKDIEPGSALDFSSQGLQDAPSGKHGWLKSVGGHFEFENLPGVGQRFYGVNLCYSANYLDHDLADRLVDRLVRFGYNSVRIHHHDGIWAKEQTDLLTPNGVREEVSRVSGEQIRLLTQENSVAPREDSSIDRLDYLLAKCFERGIYVTTDLYVSRPVNWRDIGIDRDGEMSKKLYKTYVGIHDGAFADWCKWARAFLEHVNPYTGRAYKDEPGLPLISLINEGCVVGKDDPVVRKAWREFCASGGEGAESTSPAEAPPQDGAIYDRFNQWVNRRVWERCSAFVRSLGCRALLTNDNAGRWHGEGEGLTPLYDYVDCHSYVDHPVFLEQPWRLPFKCVNSNPIKDGKPAVFYRGWADGASKPYVLTEWNFSGPGRYRGMGGILVGALAAEHGWDGLWRFAYSHDRRGILDGGRGGSLNFDLAEDPLMAASDRAGVCLFLRGDAAKEQSDERRVTSDEREEADGSALRLDRERGSMAIITPRTCGGFAESGRMDAGPLSFEIADACVRGAADNSSLVTRHSSLRGGHIVPTTLWASTLDGEPLERSSRILLTHLTDVQGEGARYADDSRKILLKWGKTPLVEAGAADVELRLDEFAANHSSLVTRHSSLDGEAAASGFTVYALDTAGNRTSKIPAVFEAGALRFRVSTNGPEGGCIYYEIVRTAMASMYFSP